IRSERGAEGVEAIEGLAEPVVCALGGRARPQQLNDAASLDGPTGFGHEQQCRGEQRLAGLRKASDADGDDGVTESHQVNHVTRPCALVSRPTKVLTPSSSRERHSYYNVIRFS